MEETLLVFLETANALLDGFELFSDIESGDVADGGGGGPEGVETANTDLEEFVEIGAGDGEELDAVEKRELGAKGFVEDALIEFEPGEFAVEVRRLHENE